jgi:hypothetical protein
VDQPMTGCDGQRTEKEEGRGAEKPHAGVAVRNSVAGSPQEQRFARAAGPDVCT